MPNTTMFVLIQEKEIIYIRNNIYLEGGVHRIIDTIYREFFKDATARNFKEIVYKLCYSLGVDNCKFEVLPFDLGNLESGTMIFNMSTLQKENYSHESIIAFNALNIDVSLRSLNHTIDGGLIKAKSMYVHLTTKTSL
jgi:hypothetical protein